MIKNLDKTNNCDKLSAMLHEIHCSCGKLIGRGRGIFEIPCRYKNNHGGERVLVLGEATAMGTKIYNVRPEKDSGVSVEMIP